VSTPAEQAAFFKQWETYRKVIGNDYMSHRAVGEALGRWLAERKITGRALDLGCGDARLMSGVLAAAGFTHYTGVDMSAMALEMARGNLEAAGLEFSLHESDLESFLPNARGQRFDLVTAGYSLHHLRRDGKQRVFQEVVWHPAFAVYDVFKEEGESRERYLERYLAWMESWEALTPDERDRAAAHIREYDFPEDETSYLDLAAESGWNAPKEIWRDASGFHRLLVFAKDAA